jgi:hypothetical protein
MNDKRRGRVEAQVSVLLHLWPKILEARKSRRRDDRDAAISFTRAIQDEHPKRQILSDQDLVDLYRLNDSQAPSDSRTTAQVIVTSLMILKEPQRILWWNIVSDAKYNATRPSSAALYEEFCKLEDGWVVFHAAGAPSLIRLII